MHTIIATTTFYKDIENSEMDKIRFASTCKTIENARNATSNFPNRNYPIVVVDNSRDRQVTEQMKKLGATVYPQTLKGMGPSRRLAFFYALHELFFNEVTQIFQTSFIEAYPLDGIIFWNEPDKHDVIRLIPEVIAPIESGEADISIMKRSEKSWLTYARFQQESEKRANKAYEQATGRIGYDPMDGPVAFRASVLQQHLLYNYHLCQQVNDTYIQHYIPLLIPAERVASVEVDFHYPPEQKAIEEAADNKEIRKKRQWQEETLSGDYHKLAQILKLEPFA